MPSTSLCDVFVRVYSHVKTEVGGDLVSLAEWLCTQKNGCAVRAWHHRLEGVEGTTGAFRGLQNCGGSSVERGQEGFCSIAQHSWGATCCLFVHQLKPSIEGYRMFQDLTRVRSSPHGLRVDVA
ncbi:unnamed protein product [Durusdinium trenchii]|uniref:Uncharacterized protein n=1 Tax=Durusdinium trenchii TaxID=1381693 RepID=A0ABP0Q1F2_9DINO